MTNHIWNNKRDEATVKVQHLLSRIDDWKYLDLITKNADARRDIAVMALGPDSWSLGVDTLVRIQVSAELGRISRDEALARIAEIPEDLGLEVAGQ